MEDHHSKSKYADVPQEVYQVTSQAAADWLTQPQTSYYLVPFMRAELTLSEAAKKLAISPSRLYYQVKKLLKLGLLRVLRVQKRGGRASPIYRAVAQRFVIPYHQTSAASMTAIMYEMREPAYRNMVRHYLRNLQVHYQAFALWLFVNDEGLFETHYAPLDSKEVFDLQSTEADDFPAVFSRILNLELDASMAKEVQRELLAIYSKVLAHNRQRVPKDSDQTYLMDFSIVPIVRS